MPKRRLAIVTPMEREISEVRRAVSSWDQTEQTDLNELLVQFHVLGIGKKKVQVKLQELLAVWDRPGQAVDGVLLVGFAGGLDPALRPGDLVLPARYCQPENPSLEPDGALRQRAIEAAQASGLRVSHEVSHGDSLTVDRLVTTPEGKADLAQSYGAVIVDMEDYWVAAACAQAQIPFLAVRAVLDPAGQSLPDYLPGMAGQGLGAVGGVLARPWHGPTLLRLARQMRLAQQSLARFALAWAGSSFSHGEIAAPDQTAARP
jgi:purine-nucleoside phosphorylase